MVRTEDMLSSIRVQTAGVIDKRGCDEYLSTTGNRNVWEGEKKINLKKNVCLAHDVV